MKIRCHFTFAALAMFASSPALAQPDIPVGKEFTILNESILCTSSESLFLLFEGSYLANMSGGKPAFQSYFSNAVQTLAEQGICMFNDKDRVVEVTGVNVHRNVAKANLGNKVYAGFMHPGQNRLMFANADSVPGLLEHLSAITKQSPVPSTQP